MLVMLLGVPGDSADPAVGVEVGSPRGEESDNLGRLAEMRGGSDGERGDMGGDTASDWWGRILLSRAGVWEEGGDSVWAVGEVATGTASAVWECVWKWSSSLVRDCGLIGSSRAYGQSRA